MYDTRRKHIHSNHKKTSDFYCHHCGACFIDLDSLRTHFADHKSERIFECEFCEKRFFEKRNLVDHRELHRDNKSFQCNICDRFYISSKSLQRHIKLHLSSDGRSCQSCQETFHTREELVHHMQERHSTVRGDHTPAIDGYEHHCNICDRKFLFKSRLIKHMQIHNEDATPDLYDCPTCSKTFDTKSMPLWKHMKQEHPEEMKKQSMKKEMMCELCGFSTIHKQRLERHMETHNPEKRFQCRYCEKMFQTTSSMLTHMIIHRGKIKKGIRTHSNCSWPNCHKSFLKHSNMKRHLLSHIFKVKVNKDWCDCKKCEKKNEDLLGAPTGDYEFFEDDGTGNYVKLSSAVMSRMPGGTEEGTLKLVMNPGGGMEGYESMDVLQEAIAQIEDIEKNSGNNSVVAGELTPSSQASQLTHASQVETVEEEVQLDGTQMAGGASKMDVMGQAVVSSQEGTAQVPDQVVQPDTVALPDTQQHEPGPVEGKPGNSEVVTTDQEVVAEISAVPATTNAVEEAVMGEQGITECIYECGVCDLMFETKCQVLAHLEDEHIDNRFPQCDQCHKFYIDRKNLTEHKSIHLGSREFTCDVCSKSFRTKQCLRQHQYIHAEVKPFNCTYCGHGFTQRGFFDEHVRRHTGDRPFRCIICTKGFVSKNLLKLHMYSHTGNRPHKCQHCTKSFAENYQLVAHLRTHNDDRPFQCTECDKAFFVKPKLIRHMNTVHSIEKEYLSNYVPTRIGDGVGYRDRNKVKNAKGDRDRKTQVVYIDGQGNIISQEVKTERELRQQKERIRSQKPHVQKLLRPHQPVSSSVVVLQPPTVTTRETMTETEQADSFEVVTRRDSSGQIQVDLDRSTEHVIIENDGMPMGEQVVMHNTDGSETIVSIPDSSENIVYQEMTAGSEASIELNGQNYTLVTQADGSGQEGHLQLITQALAAQGDTDQGQIQVITEEIAQEDGQTMDDGSIQIYTQEAVDAAQEGAENISINIGEDGTVDAADFEKIEALRSLYNDQPIVIVLESQHQE